MPMGVLCLGLNHFGAPEAQSLSLIERGHSLVDVCHTQFSTKTLTRQERCYCISLVSFYVVYILLVLMWMDALPLCHQFMTLFAHRLDILLIQELIPPLHGEWAEFLIIFFHHFPTKLKGLAVTWGSRCRVTKVKLNADSIPQVLLHFFTSEAENTDLSETSPRLLPSPIHWYVNMAGLGH